MFVRPGVGGFGYAMIWLELTSERAELTDGDFDFISSVSTRRV